MAFGALYEGRIYPGVSVAGISLSGLTKHDATRLLANKAKDYSISVKVSTTSFAATPDTLGAQYDINATVDQAYVSGRGHTFPLLVFFDSRYSGNRQYSYSIDQTKLSAFVDKLASTVAQPASDAQVVTSNGVLSLVPDKPGRTIEKGQLMQDLDNMIADGKSGAIEIEPVKLSADIHLQQANSALEIAKQLIATPITVTYGTQTFNPSSAQLASWITYSKTKDSSSYTLIPTITTDSLSDYVASIANQVDVAPVTAEVTVLNGVSTTNRTGVDGLVVNRGGLAAAIANAIMTRSSDPIVVPTNQVAFTTLTNNTQVLNYPQYVEVNLTTQHLWAWQDGQIIYDSPVTSGATGAGFPTVTGLFHIYEKNTDRHLVGYQYGPQYNYDVFVQYWMAFYGGYGLHDASWRSTFGETSGPSGYWYDGSHGCVNLPLATAAWLYGWTSIGTPVWVHS
jgi:lipoprotein-anchoring transpeptidase ErfK/SrfK